MFVTLLVLAPKLDIVSGCFFFPKKNQTHKVVLKNNSALTISCLILPIQMSYSSES